MKQINYAGIVFQDDQETRALFLNPLFMQAMAGVISNGKTNIHCHTMFSSGRVMNVNMTLLNCSRILCLWICPLYTNESTVHVRSMGFGVNRSHKTRCLQLE